MPTRNVSRRERTALAAKVVSLDNEPAEILSIATPTAIIIRRDGRRLSVDWPRARKIIRREHGAFFTELDHRSHPIEGKSMRSRKRPAIYFILPVFGIAAVFTLVMLMLLGTGWNAWFAGAWMFVGVMATMAVWILISVLQDDLRARREKAVWNRYVEELTRRPDSSSSDPSSTWKKSEIDE